MNKTNGKKNKLAWELAEALNDREAIDIYQKFTEKYQPEFLRETLNKVMSVPEDKIRQSRGALFTYLVNRHGN
jgi:hypothetical protein